MSFDKLLEELNAESDLFTKAMGDDGNDDAKIAAAAGDTDDDGKPGDDGDDVADVDDDVDEDDKGQMAKSMTVTLENGETVEALDATEILKSLGDRMDANEGQMLKAMESAIGLIRAQGAALAEQKTMIKSLQDKVASLSNEGRGRKTVVAVAEKPAGTDMTKSHADGLTPDQFMTKALSAQAEGRLTAIEVATAEACLNRGQPVPAHIISRVGQ